MGLMVIPSAKRSFSDGRLTFAALYPKHPDPRLLPSAGSSGTAHGVGWGARFGSALIPSTFIPYCGCGGKSCWPLLFITTRSSSRLACGQTKSLVTYPANQIVPGETPGGGGVCTSFDSIVRSLSARRKSTLADHMLNASVGFPRNAGR